MELKKVGTQGWTTQHGNKIFAITKTRGAVYACGARLKVRQTGSATRVTHVGNLTEAKAKIADWIAADNGEVVEVIESLTKKLLSK